MIKEILTFVGGGGILLAIVAWVVRSIINHYLTKDVEKYRDALKAESFRFSRLHEKRGEVIAQLYANLDELVKAVYSFVHLAEWAGEPSKDEKRKIAGEALKKFQDHFDKNRIYFSETLCYKIDNFVREFTQPAAKYAIYLKMSEDTDGSVRKEKDEAWFSAYNKMEKDVPETKKAIENEFRSLLGVEEPKGSSINSLQRMADSDR